MALDRYHHAVDKLCAMLTASCALQPEAFSWMMTSWALGSIAGPAVGGALADPCTSLNSLRSTAACAPDHGTLRRLPFLLPFGLLASATAGSVVLCVVAMSPPARIKAICDADDSDASTQRTPAAEAASAVDDARADSLDSQHKHQAGGLLDARGRLANGRNPSAAPSLELSHLLADASQGAEKSAKAAASIEDDAQLLLAAHHAGQANSPNDNASPTADSEHRVDEQHSIRWWQHRGMLQRLAAYGVTAWAFCMLAESIPIYSAMPAAHGGLALSSAQLAVPLSVGGVWLVVSALLLYPRVQGRLGNRRCAATALAHLRDCCSSALHGLTQLCSTL